VKPLPAISGFGMILGGMFFLLAWKRERKYPNQKTIGLGAIALGCLLVVESCL
jgi:hypothetical protein